MHFSWVASHLYFDGSEVRTRSPCKKHEQNDVTSEFLQILRQTTSSHALSHNVRISSKLVRYEIRRGSTSRYAL